ncbi:MULTISPECIES: DUF982 domain-containing protein [unclassified Mesorhizobium]|uniref:DUF982 domain-containing protein n=1 Tax=unclassified Mesorhizobium TaxID=325217 RepID=UPI0033374CBE
MIDDVRFAEPITLKFQSSERKVASSWEAIDCMCQQWPDRARGRSWRGAYRTCRDALDGWRTACDARKAFVRAARKAGELATSLPRFGDFVRCLAADRFAPQWTVIMPFTARHSEGWIR